MLTVGGMVLKKIKQGPCSQNLYSYHRYQNNKQQIGKLTHEGILDGVLCYEQYKRGNVTGTQGRVS